MLIPYLAKQTCCGCYLASRSIPPGAAGSLAQGVATPYYSVGPLLQLAILLIKTHSSRNAPLPWLYLLLPGSGGGLRNTTPLIYFIATPPIPNYRFPVVGLGEARVSQP